MMLPLGTDRSLRRPTLMNHALIVLNIAAFIAKVALEKTDPVTAKRLVALLELNPDHFRWWALLSYAFLHANFMHIAGNMVFLWVFGPNVEDRFGRVGYLVFYLMGALASAAVYMVFYSSPMLGASGAIAAVTGAYLVLFPHTRIKVLVLFYLIGVYEITAWWLITGQIVWNIVSEGAGWSGGVATMAHLGGYAWGVTVGMLLLATGILKREPYDLFTMAKQAARRRQFREVNFQRQQAVERGEHPDQAIRARRAGADAAAAEALAQARAEVSSQIPENFAAAAAAYRKLLEAYGTAPGAALLGRRSQYELANYLFESGDHPTAATAYQVFLDGYPTDRELPVVRLMLGLISARYLNDPVRAKQEIGKALPDLPEGQRDLAKELLTELG